MCRPIRPRHKFINVKLFYLISKGNNLFKTTPQVQEVRLRQTEDGRFACQCRNTEWSNNHCTQGGNWLNIQRQGAFAPLFIQ